MYGVFSFLGEFVSLLFTGRANLCSFNLAEQPNTRVLFERVLPGLAAADARDVWQRFQTYETLAGDLPAVARVEERRSAAFPSEFNDHPIRHMVVRPVVVCQLKGGAAFRWGVSNI